MIVVDASAVLEILLRTPAASAVESRVFRPGETLHAPHLLDVEAAQVIRRYVALGQIPRSRGAQAVEDLAVFPLARYPHVDLLPRIWELRGNLTAYDAAYVSLAEALKATLVTRDRRLAAAPARRIRIDVI